MKTWDVWREGFMFQGAEDHALLLGHAEAESFAEACVIVVGADQYNAVDQTMWGCRLFDNEVAARRKLG